MSRYIHHTISIRRDIHQVFNALIQPSMIKKWWHATSVIVLPEVGGFYVASWGINEDDPDYISYASIKAIEPPVRLELSYDKYYAKENPLPFNAHMEATFLLETISGETHLSVRQTGFPSSVAADDYYQACVKGWEDTFNSLKKVLEEGQLRILEK